MLEIVLTGLDGSNPLAFLAGLGMLNVLADRSDKLSHSRLSWRPMGAWRAVLHVANDDRAEQLVTAVMEDLEAWSNEAAIDLHYGPAGQIRDLKPPPDVFSRYLQNLCSRATAFARGSVDLAAALATDVAKDRSGNTKPTMLHFTAGQQQFLAMVRGLLECVTPEDIQEALFGPWRYDRKLPVLQWDATASRDYALRASDPSKDKKAGVPGADWLAFRGLSFIRVAPIGSRIMTTGCIGEWKTACFRWPLWTVPLSRPVVHTLLGIADPDKLDAQQRRERGIGIIFESRIRRSEQGGYGSFCPPSVV